MSYGVWLTGLSGSGKSAIARELVRLLHERGVEVSVLESDVMRTQLTPFARYDEPERDFFYGALADIGAALVAKARPVVFDATANRRRYRNHGISTLPGAQAPYEPPLAPELVVHGDRGTPQEAAALIVAQLQNRGWLDLP